MCPEITIEHCDFINNYTEAGGAISAGYSYLTIDYCTFLGDTAYDGGALHLGGIQGTISNSLFANNHAFDSGGGIYFGSGCMVTVDNCTFVDNQADFYGGIYCLSSAFVQVINSIFWDNTAPHINSTPTVSYCDVSGGFPGTGNINQEPLFISPLWDDYRLQWSSPCIDAGNPDPLYNDPDGTIADMGAFYYDQSVPVRILMTPHDTPIQIPAAGGSFDYTLTVTNIDPLAPEFSAWCDVILPDGSVFGPLLGPVTAQLDSGITVDRERSQAVPAGAPGGTYHYNAYAVVGADTSFDSFVFTKLGGDGFDWASGWLSSGESFDDLCTMTDVEIPEEYSLSQNYPNPFNPTTTISYRLPEASFVNLVVCDMTGRKVVDLANGTRIAGYHEVMFDASDLASGIYFYRIEAGDFSAVRKMVLIK